MPEKWRDLAVEATLWESQRGGDIELMLKRSRTNSRINEKMGRWIMAVNGITKNWHGKYKDLLGDISGELQDHYLNMEAFARNQAIELAAAVAKANAPVAAAPEEKKRGGILGLLHL